MAMGNKKILLLVALLIMSLGLGTLFSVRYFSAPENLMALQLLPAPKPLPPIALESHTGDVFSNKQFNNHWSLVFFGFTHCPDMCPLELQQLNRLLQLAERQSAIKIQVIFISLDPERDSREKIAEYLANFNSLMLGVRGTHAELSTLSRFFAVDYSREPAEGAMDNYQIVHSGRIFLVDPNGHYLGSFVQPHNVDAMWNDLNILIQ